MAVRAVRRRVPVAILASSAAVLGMAAALAVGGASAEAATGVHGLTRQIAVAGTAHLTAQPGGTATGVENPEFPGTFGSDGADAGGTDRSNTPTGGTAPVGPLVQPAPVTRRNSELITSFSGLDHFDQRFGSTDGNNAFSLEPPDQGLCVGSDGNGNTRVLEVVNDVLRIFTTSGAAVTAPQSLNDFFGYAPSINRTTVVLGPFVTDPSCLYDAVTGHWFLDVLTIDSYPQIGDDGLQHFTGTNHLDLAVSETSDPAGGWTIYRIPVQDDGTDGTPNHHCSPGHETEPPLPTNPTACFGDYPHIGSDSNGIYLTTNEYSFFGTEFHGAQVYAMPKSALAAGAATIPVVQFDTHGMDHFGFALNGFTLWPSTTPGGGGDPTAGGTEYFMSSNSAAEAHDPGDGSSTSAPSTQLLVWALTGTSSLASGPFLTLSVTELGVGEYAPPPKAGQKSGPEPLRQCLNNNTCSTVLEGIADPFVEMSSPLDANDSRMQQVTWVGGRLWGALDTALTVGASHVAGIEWFTAAPSTASGPVTAKIGRAHV